MDATTKTADLRAAYPITSQHRAQFERDGYIRLSNVLSAETIAYYEPEITRKVIELNTMHLPMEERSTYNKAFLQIGNIWEKSDLVKELAFSPRLARIAADLMGVQAVRMYHDQALYKEGGGGITPYHADQYYWPLDSDRICTVWLPLQETPLEMGPLAFAVGSHRFEYGRDLEISDQSEEMLQRLLSERGYVLDEQAYTLGDASYHLGWTFHRAEPNRTEVPRRVMTIIYVDADMKLTEPINPNQVHEIEVLMPGLKTGDKLDTPLHPLLYDRR